MRCDQRRSVMASQIRCHLPHSPRAASAARGFFFSRTHKKLLYPQCAYFAILTRRIELTSGVVVRLAIALTQRPDRAAGVMVHMAQISVLIPQRNAAAALASQLPEVCSTLSQISRDYEVIVIDDASETASRTVLEDLVGDLPCLRVIELEPACGLSAALTAGLAAATGQLVFSLPAGEALVEPLMESMLEALARSDLVVGRPTRHGWRKALHRLAHSPLVVIGARSARPGVSGMGRSPRGDCGAAAATRHVPLPGNPGGRSRVPSRRGHRADAGSQHVFVRRDGQPLGPAGCLVVQTPVAAVRPDRGGAARRRDSWGDDTQSCVNSRSDWKSNEATARRGGMSAFASASPKRSRKDGRCTMSTRPRTIFFSVGEPSGDLHGGNLIRVLKQQDPTLNVVGFGGPRMQAAGMTLLEDLTQLAVMWILQAVVNVHKFWKLLRQAEQYFQNERPDAVVLIDYPGFNWWVARQAKKHGVPVFYYGAPQMWAWGGWRIKKMQRLVDHVLCKLPFETHWYQQRGCQAKYVGHPYFDELLGRQTDTDFLRHHAPTDVGRLVVLLPGSRKQEVRGNLPCFLRAAQQVAEQVPGTRFAVASFNQEQAEMARQLVARSQLEIPVYAGKTSELIQLAHCCLACSGSVSLELMYFAKPSVIHYLINRNMYYFAKACLLRVKYMTLVNLLACEDRYDMTHAPFDPAQPGADQVPFPEYPTWSDKSQQLAQHVVQWLTCSTAYRRRVDQLAGLRSRFAHPGATQRAAQAILDQLGKPPVVHAPTMPASRAA